MTPVASDRTIGSSPLELPSDLICVWRVYLDRDSAQYQTRESILSPDELDRARRYHFERDRRRFTVARSALRMILSEYLGSDPKHLAFNYGAHGKPSLAGENSGIRFNVSHSGELAVIAVARDRELGVDVECLRSSAWVEQIPERFFSPREVKVLRSLPRELLQDAFFACWTRKEAYIKARGGGLSIGLDSFDVSLEPDKPAALLQVRDDPNEAARWGMAELRPASGYSGALVAQGKDWRFNLSDWMGQPGLRAVGYQ
jgi:4'-phosphopantetheinyl transferase